MWPGSLIIRLFGGPVPVYLPLVGLFLLGLWASIRLRALGLFQSWLVVPGLLLSLGLAAWSWHQGLVLGPLRAQPFGFFLGIGLFFGAALARRQARRAGLDPVVGGGLLFTACLGGLLGARVGHFIRAGGLGSPWEVLALSNGGLSGVGALLGAGAAVALWCKRCQVRGAPWLDVATPGLLACIAFTRLGSYLAGSEFGRVLPASAPAWLSLLGSVPRGALDQPFVVWSSQVEAGLIDQSAPWSLPAHPIALYEALPVWAFALASSFFAPLKTRHGVLFGLAAFGCVVVRLVSGVFR